MALKNLALAKDDFRRARSQAAMEDILARLTGQSTELLCYDDVVQKLKATGKSARGLQEIPIDAIVGSVGRCSDFTRSFLPRKSEDEDRWARVDLAMSDLGGVPPIEVYKVGEVYFVLDGNHRVSVARQQGAEYIQAHVVEVKTKVPLSSDVQPDDLIVKAEYADFLERTHLDELRPGADLSVSVPGQYESLLHHIEVHRHFMGLEQQREIPYQEAVAHWYDNVYMPVVKVIRKQDILHEFPKRTETDLYLWISEHRAALEENLEWEVPSEVAATDLADQFSPKLRRAFARVSEKVLEVMMPEEIAPGPPPGKWRSEQELEPDLQESRLFADILVPIGVEESTWNALEQAIVIARRQEGRLLGLHVVASEDEMEGEAVQAIEAEFRRRCDGAGIPGKLIVEVGKIASRICERGRWLNLVVVNLAHPPGNQPIHRLSSGFRAMIQRCVSPILAVPGDPSPLSCILLAYDGGARSEEALFVSTYLAGRWDIPLVVVTVSEKEDTTTERMERARTYLEEHGVQATCVEKQGPVDEVVLDTARENGCDLIVIGGYGASPVLEIVLGSVVDQILRESEHPVLICQ